MKQRVVTALPYRVVLKPLSGPTFDNPSGPCVNDAGSVDDLALVVTGVPTVRSQAITEQSSPIFPLASRFVKM